MRKFPSSKPASGKSFCFVDFSLLLCTREREVDKNSSSSSQENLFLLWFFALLSGKSHTNPWLFDITILGVEIL